MKRVLIPTWIGFLVERQLNASPWIQEAFVLGTGRPHIVALLIPPKGENQVTYEDITPLIEEINMNLKPISKLSMDRIKILDPSDEFVTTFKGEMTRSGTEAKYRSEIDKLYENTKM